MLIEVFSKSLAIIFSLLILYNAAYIKQIVGTWLFPATLFSLFWFAYTFFPLIIMFEVPINPWAVGYIALLVILFSWTFVFFNWKKAFKLNLNKPPVNEIYDTKFLKRILWFSIIFSVFSSLMQIMFQGISLLEIFTNSILVASKFAEARYSSELNYTIYGPLSLTFSYLAVLIGGLIFGATNEKKTKRIVLLSFLPALIVMITQSAKGLFFGSFFYFLGGIMITSLYQSNLQLLKISNIKIVLKIGLISVILIAFSFMSRGLQNIDNSIIIFERLRFLFASYFFAHLYNFSDWFQAFLNINTKMVFDVSYYHYGYYTFTSIFNFFGSSKITPMGTYDEYNIHLDLMQSNVYTMFRGMIMDFGLIGSTLFIIINGYVLHLIYYQFLIKSRPIFTTVILIFMLVYFYLSFGVSLLTWNIIPFVFVLMVLILKLNSFKFVLGKNY